MLIKQIYLCKSCYFYKLIYSKCIIYIWTFLVWKIICKTSERENPERVSPLMDKPIYCNVVGQLRLIKTFLVTFLYSYILPTQHVQMSLLSYSQNKISTPEISKQNYEPHFTILTEFHSLTTFLPDPGSCLRSWFSVQTAKTVTTLNGADISL